MGIYGYVLYLSSVSSIPPYNSTFNENFPNKATSLKMYVFDFQKDQNWKIGILVCASIAFRELMKIPPLKGLVAGVVATSTFQARQVEVFSSSFVRWIPGTCFVRLCAFSARFCQWYLSFSLVFSNEKCHVHEPESIW